jgi:hypothetical protein
MISSVMILKTCLLRNHIFTQDRQGLSGKEFDGSQLALAFFTIADLSETKSIS